MPTQREVQELIRVCLVEAPLYRLICEQDLAHQVIATLLSADESFDMHCTECDAQSTFRTVPTSENVNRAKAAKTLPAHIMHPFANETDFCVHASCARDPLHTARFHFLYTSGSGIEKIGQHPSLADIAGPEAASLKGALGKDRAHELNKAIGLAAHGVGVGSYIYLRRIFESLVEEAHQTASKDASWDEEAYMRSRMAEKIQLLASYLPDFLVETPQLYGILSKHIHELSEQECLDNFPLMKEAIIIIAHDRQRAMEAAAHRANIAKLIAAAGVTTAAKKGTLGSADAK